MYNTFNFSSISNLINIEFTLINKTMTRIPENLWLLLNGTKHLHIIESNYNNATIKCIFNNGKSSISAQGIDTGNVGFVPIDRQINEYTTFPVPLNVSNDLGKDLVLYFLIMLFIIGCHLITMI